MFKVYSFLYLLYFLLFSAVLYAEPQPTKPIKIGYIGSLSGFAASYGQAVLDGVRLAVSELNSDQATVELIIEDDQSASKNTVNAYSKMRSIDKIEGLIGGSWWANSIVKVTEKDRLPFLSCETLYNKDAVLADNYYILGGDLRQWVRVYQPLVSAKQFKTAAIVRFTSGFAQTLAEEMQQLFSSNGRRFLKEIEYSDVQMTEAAALALKVKKLAPDVIYVDAQPASFANLMKRLAEIGLNQITVFSNSVAEDAALQQLFNPAVFKNIYFTRRMTYREDFVEKYQKHYGKRPYLKADLGYYATHLLVQALQSSAAMQYLKKPQSAAGSSFSFDQHNVYGGMLQEVWTFKNGRAEILQLPES